VLPRPFTRIAIAIGAPVYIDRATALGDVAVVQDLQHRMEQELHRQFQLAREALG
jgi:lysophospholipid acyltransferase (LPLAT)-like uncharacterized protein